MNKSMVVGASFGVTSGIITTLGLMVGMAFGTQSKLLVVGAILTIAIADSLSDSLGIHISEESDKSTTKLAVWQATMSAFLAKFVFTLTFLIPIYFLDLNLAVFVNIVWGLLSLCVLSYLIAKSNNEKTLNAVFEHVFIAVLVLGSTYLLGTWINGNFV